jgi:4-oxalocrotonate tautomerase
VPAENHPGFSIDRWRERTASVRYQKEPYHNREIAGQRRDEHVPVVIVNMWPGRDDNARRRIAEGITKVFENEKIPRGAVQVIMYEVPKNNWAEGGKLFSD